MEQIYNMSAENVRQFAYEYLRCGVTSRAIQCFERLKWLGKLRQQESLLLSTIYSTQYKFEPAMETLKRYNIIYM